MHPSGPLADMYTRCRHLLLSARNIGGGRISSSIPLRPLEIMLELTPQKLILSIKALV